MLEINRRSLITGLVSFIAAPAIVRVSSIMPVRALDFEMLELMTREEMLERWQVSVSLLRIVECP